MTYAKGTEVPVDRSRAEIEKLLDRAGAATRAVLTDSSRAVLVFEMQDRRIRFTLPLPATAEFQRTQSGRARPAGGAGRAHQQRIRELWRALLLTLKAKLESVESGIETFEEAFLAQTVMPDGWTVGEHAIPAIASSYEKGRMVPLLPGAEPKAIALPGPKKWES